MREIAEFISVLACAFFTGAAVYITFIEHPARMQCGVEVAATEFAPSYRRAPSCKRLGRLSVCYRRSRRGSPERPSGGCWSPAGQCDPVYPDSDPAHQLAVAQPSIRSAISRSRAPAPTLECIARREECAQWVGIAAFPVFGDLRDGCAAIA